ncbi:MAG: hypothetical protein AB7R69_03155 [Candidatus Babeliales bacterium]
MNYKIIAVMSFFMAQSGVVAMEMPSHITGRIEQCYAVTCKSNTCKDKISSYSSLFTGIGSRQTIENIISHHTNFHVQNGDTAYTRECMQSKELSWDSLIMRCALCQTMQESNLPKNLSYDNYVDSFIEKHQHNN